MTFPLVTARYVRFHITALTGCTDCDWLFLGEGRVGRADTVGDVCTVDSDCGGAQCVPDPDLQPQVVLGQPSLTDSSACNGDGTGQLFPARAPASATSLCLIEPLQISIGETVFSSSMEVDGNGALFVADLFNHRVLKFDDPFATDAVADDVWGQTDFAGNLCNRGGTAPTNKSFCFIGNWVPRAGVALDDQGNLWVADSMNARVLRFPNTGGAIAHEADVVLGQHSFTARNYGGPTRGLDEMLFPLDVAFDPSTHRLYVADAGFGASDSRVLEFSPPFTATGTPAIRALPLSLYCDFDFGTRPLEVRLDAVTHQLWVENSCFFTELFSLDSTPTASLRVKMPQSDGIDVDAQGNLFAIGKWSGLYRYPRSQISLDAQANDFLKQMVVPGFSPHAADSISGPGGVTVFGNQLVVADADRLMIWNDYDPAALEHHGQPMRNGEPADDVYGEPDLDSDGNLYRWLQYFAYPQVEKGQLWVQRVTRGINDVLMFSAPL